MVNKKFEGYWNITKEAERKAEPLSLFVYTFATSRKPLQVSSKLTCESDKDNGFHKGKKKAYILYFNYAISIVVLKHIIK
jgi:hypothetical protein